MVRYGMSDVVGASYGWCWDTAVLCTRMFELGPLLLSASSIFNDYGWRRFMFRRFMANVLWLWLMVMVSFVLGGVMDDMRRE